MTHIRDDIKTVCPERAHSSVWFWEAYCGEQRPSSSISEKHAREIIAGHIPPFNKNAVEMCPRCISLLVSLVSPQTEP